MGKWQCKSISTCHEGISFFVFFGPFSDVKFEWFRFFFFLLFRLSFHGCRLDEKETVVYNPMTQNHDIRRSLSILDRVKGLRAKIQTERGHDVVKREKKRGSLCLKRGPGPTIDEVDDVSTGRDFLKSFVSIILRQHGMDGIYLGHLC